MLQVKVAPIVNHDWEHRFYFGRLVAVHRSGLFVAYVLKGLFYSHCFII
jgi:hypothetical protein